MISAVCVPSLKAIGIVVSEKMFEWNIGKNKSQINKWSITSKVTNQFLSHEQIWERLVPGVCVPSLEAIRPVVP